MKSLYGDLLLHRLNEQPSGKLYTRLYDAIRGSIVDGSLTPQTRLPASRDLAQELQLSRNTVLKVYEQLLAEGYIVSKVGSGTFVNEIVPDILLSEEMVPSINAVKHSVTDISLRGLTLLQHASASPKQWGAFMPGIPDVSAFPHKLFSRYLARINRSPSPQQLTYNNHSGGSAELRNALVDYLRIARSVYCSAEQVLITEGIHQALDLVTRMLCNPGDYAWIEEPGYWGIRNILRMNEINICPIIIDEAGMVPPDDLSTIPPRLIFVTPSHQYPLGSIMSQARRQQLLAIAHKTGGWIIEDDYDSEFRFSGQPIPSLQGLEDAAPVIYIGTFSKTLYPGLRLGYVVLPQPLVAPLKTAHAELYRAGHIVTQTALAQFIQDGHFSAHIRRMRLLYSKRRQFLTGLINEHLGRDALHSFNSNAGLHVILNLPSGVDDVTLADAANTRGVLVRPLSRYFMGAGKQHGLLMGFASVPEPEIEAAFDVLLDCMRQQNWRPRSLKERKQNHVSNP